MDPRLEQAAELVRAPHSNTTTDVTATVTLALAAGVSSTAQDLQATHTLPPSGAYYNFICDADATIAFGLVDMPDADSNDWPLPANVEKPFYVNPLNETHMKSFSAAGGTLKFYRSGTNQ